MYKAYVVEVKELRPHGNADRLQIATFFGNSTVVDLKIKVGDIGIYFPTDLQVSEEFAKVNDLLRRKDENGNPCGGFLDPDKRNIKAIRLRGEKSDGMFLPLTCLESFGDISTLKPGDTIDVFNGHRICEKYIPKGKHKTHEGRAGNKTRKHTAPIAPLFVEHADTEQLAYNLDAFKVGDEIEITLKMHGTSQRTGYLPKLVGYKRSIWDRITKKPGEPIYDWGYVTGTRRVVMDDFDGGFYSSNAFREQHAKKFEGKLWKGEEVFYEVVGFTDTGASIMGDGNNKKVQDKEFVKKYGDTTVFSYGCEPLGYKTVPVHDKDNVWVNIPIPQSDIYVYRMTMTNEDGNIVEYTPDFMRYRCEQMGVKTVPVLAKGVINYDGTVSGHDVITEEDFCYCYGREVKEGDPYTWTYTPGESVKEMAEKYYDGADPVGKKHIREGVVVRIVNKPKFTAYKHKNHDFKVISGIIADAIADSDKEVNEDILAEM